MSGNVYEWVWDWYGRYSSGTQSDPIGVTSSSYRVLRGGGYGSDGVWSVRVSGRDYYTTANQNHYYGFRLRRLAE